MAVAHTSAPLGRQASFGGYRTIVPVHGPTLFVTGMQRSGTTLLEKLLSSHPSISLLSQPFPYLFLQVKRAFFGSLDLEPPAYPLGPLFRETRYSQQALRDFLAELSIQRPALEEAFTAMEGFSGQYTKFGGECLRRAFDGFRPGDLASTMRQLYRSLAHDPDATWCGGKETLCEELLPFLLDRGIHAVVIVRDPRDVLASLNHGRGARFAGAPKPTLFNLRNWRKSVAFALHLENHPNFLWLRYEDLVSDTEEALGRISRLLRLPDFDRDQFAAGVPGQDGGAWTGNSSHSAYSGISRSSVGRYLEVLPVEVHELIEVVCRPELQRLGYPSGPRPRNPRRVIETFHEPYPMARSDLDHHLPNAETRRDEISRLDLLEQWNPQPERVRKYFLFEDVYSTLRGASLP